MVLFIVENYLLNKRVSHPRRAEPLTTPIYEPQFFPLFSISVMDCIHCVTNNIHYGKIVSLNTQMKFTQSHKLQ
jgi:hypothetical protein